MPIAKCGHVFCGCSALAVRTNLGKHGLVYKNLLYGHTNKTLANATVRATWPAPLHVASAVALLSLLCSRCRYCCRGCHCCSCCYCRASSAATSAWSALRSSIHLSHLLAAVCLHACRRNKGGARARLAVLPCVVRQQLLYRSQTPGSDAMLDAANGQGQLRRKVGSPMHRNVCTSH